MSSNFYNVEGLIPTVASVAIASKLLSTPSKGRRTQRGLKMEHKRRCTGSHCVSCGRCSTVRQTGRTYMCAECRKLKQEQDRREQREIARRGRLERKVRTR